MKFYFSDWRTQWRTQWFKLSWAHLFVALASFCKAIKDTLAFHYGKSVFAGLDPQFWNPNISWKNKYADWPDDPSPAFILSDTVFVFLTDAWHLFDFLMLMCLFIAIHLRGSILWAVVIYGVVFNVAYYTLG